MGRFDWLEVPDSDREKTSQERFKEPSEQYDAQGYLQLASHSPKVNLLVSVDR